MQETQTLFECRKNTTIKATAEKHTKSKPKTHKNQNTKPGTVPTWNRPNETTDRRF